MKLFKKKKRVTILIEVKAWLKRLLIIIINYGFFLQEL